MTVHLWYDELRVDKITQDVVVLTPTRGKDSTEVTIPASYFIKRVYYKQEQGHHYAANQRFDDVGDDLTALKYVYPPDFQKNGIYYKIPLGILIENQEKDFYKSYPKHQAEKHIQYSVKEDDIISGREVYGILNHILVYEVVNDERRFVEKLNYLKDTKGNINRRYLELLFNFRDGVFYAVLINEDLQFLIELRHLSIK